MRTFKHALATSLATACAAACGADSTGTSSAVFEVAPAGSDATAVGSDIPLAMNPGERLNVRTTMRNTGLASPANNWNGNYNFRRFPNAANPFGFVFDQVTGTVPAQPNTDEDFDFVITAPVAPGNYTFQGSMFSSVVGQAGYFGQLLTVPNIVVDPANQRRWDCAYVPAMSTLPASMLATEATNVTVVVQNTGTATWPATPTSYLRSRDDVTSGDYYLWGNGSVLLPLAADVPPGGTAAFTFDIVAPAAPGGYQFSRQIFQSGQPSPTGGVGYLDLVNHCVDETITVNASSPFRDAALASQDFPPVFAPNEPRVVRVSMQNTGVETWVPNDYALTSQSNPAGLWGATIAHGDGAVATGSNEDYVFVVRGPPGVGNYSHLWRMVKYVSPGIGAFGQLVSVPATVDGAQPPFYTAALIAQTIPARVTVGSMVNFSVTMQNTGAGPWDLEFFRLRSQSTPVDLWGTTEDALAPAEVVPVGANRTFTFPVVAPAAPGVYQSRWAMAVASGPAFFFLNSDVAVQDVEVTLCGNSVIDPGESCDDGNLLDGDACNSQCGGFTIDLATDAAGRTLLGSNNIKQLANVAIGDITNDGVADVVVGEMANVYPVGEPARGRAGIVHGYTGGAAFLDNSTTRVPTGGMFQIWGGTALDRLGGSNMAGVLIGEVTGDGVLDLVVSSNFADGVGDARLDCGEAFVIAGGAALATAGIIDIGAAVPSPLITARLIGATAGAGLIALAIGDVTGDGVGDLILGSPFDDTGGADAGLVTVVPGGAGLSGTIDLALGGSVATIVGAAPGDQLGLSAAIGNLGGSADNDLVVGSSLHDAGLFNAGGAWALFGPVAGTSLLAIGAFDVRWLGADNFRYGASLEIGNVTGDNSGDLVVGAPQGRNLAAVQTGAVDVWSGPFISGQSFDVAAGATPASRIVSPDFADNPARSLALGDMNNDGFLDVPVAMNAADGPANGRNNCGELGLVLGGAVLPAYRDLAVNPPDLLIIGAAPANYLGSHPNELAMGDIDGDGQADICVGSPNGGTDATLTAPGRVDCFGSPF